MQLPGKSKSQNVLRGLLRAEIEQHGPITFARFMEQALYHPEHGYYSSGRARLGRGGDYFTSVSVGPLFGRMLAAQFAEIRQLLGSSNDFTIVEQGAHHGEFARDVLENFDGAVRYIIVEPFAALREEQARMLSQFKIEWCDSLDALAPFTGVHFSNELIDSMPVHLVKWTGTEWVERYVANGADEFSFVERPISSAQLAARLDAIPVPLPAGYETEVNLVASKWIETLTRKLTRGFIITADYGFARDEFYTPQRTCGTLQSYAQHKVTANPLLHAGEADITAHVDWTSLVEHGIAAGLQLAGFTDQHHFLTGLLTDKIAADASQTRALQTLLQPGFLGMKFQFLVLRKGLERGAKIAGLRFARDSEVALGLRRPT